MTLLDATSRARVVAQWMRKNLEAAAFSKTELAAAVDATDQWIEDNTSSFVTALPSGFRTKSTATQKTLVFVYVLMRRAGLLRAEEDG